MVFYIHGYNLRNRGYVIFPRKQKLSWRNNEAAVAEIVKDRTYFRPIIRSNDGIGLSHIACEYYFRRGCIHQRITRSYFIPGVSYSYYAYWKYVHRIKICDAVKCFHLIMINIKKTRVMDVKCYRRVLIKRENPDACFFLLYTSWECSDMLLSVVSSYYFFNI